MSVSRMTLIIKAEWAACVKSVLFHVGIKIIDLIVDYGLSLACTASQYRLHSTVLVFVFLFVNQLKVSCS